MQILLTGNLCPQARDYARTAVCLLRIVFDKLFFLWRIINDEEKVFVTWKVVGDTFFTDFAFWLNSMRGTVYVIFVSSLFRIQTNLRKLVTQTHTAQNAKKMASFLVQQNDLVFFQIVVFLLIYFAMRIFNSNRNGFYSFDAKTESINVIPLWKQKRWHSK